MPPRQASIDARQNIGSRWRHDFDARDGYWKRVTGGYHVCARRERGKVKEQSEQEQQHMGWLG